MRRPEKASGMLSSVTEISRSISAVFCHNVRVMTAAARRRRRRRLPSAFSSGVSAAPHMPLLSPLFFHSRIHEAVCLPAEAAVYFSAFPLSTDQFQLFSLFSYVLQPILFSWPPLSSGNFPDERVLQAPCPSCTLRLFRNCEPGSAVRCRFVHPV